MKTILMATVIGMICFQSCTKENKILPTEPQKNLSVNDNQTYLNQLRPTKWCATSVVNKTKPKTKNPEQTPPVFIPNIAEK